MNKYFDKKYWFPAYLCRYTILLLLLSFCIPCLKFAHKWNAESLPIPHLSDERKYVSNPDGVLSSQAVMTVDKMLYSLEKEKRSLLL